MFGSNALIITDFQLSDRIGNDSPVHLYIIKDGLQEKVCLFAQVHGAEPSPLHQADMNINELIAFGELCITLGKLYLREK